MNPLLNPGTHLVEGDLRCKSCGYVADARSYDAAMSVYADLSCPQCGSTNNDHNAVYSDRLLKNMRAAQP